MSSAGGPRSRNRTGTATSSGAHERAGAPARGGASHHVGDDLRGGASSATPAASESAFAMAPAGAGAAGGDHSSLDLDVTVLAFAQWVCEMKSRQNSSSNQMQAEMSIIRNAISSNNTELSDFKRHSAAIQQQMQGEIGEIRESLGTVFMEITNAVRNNAAADQDIKFKIQSLNEQAVRNETAFAQLADAADQSQSKLRSAVQEMQHSSERMRDELGSLSRLTENLETNLTEKCDSLGLDVEQLSVDLKGQMDRRKEQLKKMVNDVCGISASLTNWMSDFSEQKKGTSDAQNKIQSAIYSLEELQRKELAESASAAQRRMMPTTVAGHENMRAAVSSPTPAARMALSGMPAGAMQYAAPTMSPMGAHTLYR
eukprot:TRINITY_DN45922_c0_g1_i1.p1 TRINITY_DN45922_c0_g1~~TRINITY_DN45922_c0_g1_i1.p1  ORF type:complete len:371 (-),score=99.00 TRINITY_DN45922_c0_g1_i1:103-1215(-)